MGLEIVQIPVWADNYVYLAHCNITGITAVVDPAEAASVLEALKSRDWSLDFILNTHHHMDHVGGNMDLMSATGCRIVGPRADRDRIPGISLALGDGDQFALGKAMAIVFDVPGHTRGHIAYWFEDDDALFCGDTLFAMGCGKLFEGSPAQMWNSLQKFIKLPAETRVYCAHEYTEANGRFALSIEPDNQALVARMEEVRSLRARAMSTIPSTMIAELATNPFLRPDSAEIQASVGLPGHDLTEVFAAVRQRKDSF